MKRTLLTLLLSLFALAAYAQQYELSLGTGSRPYYSVYEKEWLPLIHNEDKPETLAELHRYSYEATIWPTVALGGAWHFSRWFSLVGSLGTSGVYAKFHEPFTDAVARKETSFVIDLMAGIRVKYSKGEMIRTYSQFLLGGQFHTPGDYWKINNEYGPFACQFVPIGVEIGDDTFFGFAEIGYGTEYFTYYLLLPGIRVGFGVLF